MNPPLIPFNIGDTVQFTPEALDLCDPAITSDEVCGQVLFIDVFSEQVLIRFDDGQELRYPARYLEKFVPQKSPIAP